MAPDLAALFASPALRVLFREFPSPLALLSGPTEVGTTNDAFDARFSAHSLRGGVLGPLFHAHDPAPRPLAITDVQGRPLTVQARVLRTDPGYMLVIDPPLADTTSELAHLHERVRRLERQSATDALTGAWNRGHLDRVIETEIARSTRQKQPVSLVLLDLDHFKQVNDTAGHAAGDRVLKELVRLTQARIRAADTLFRWGGEEFVVLGPSTGYRNATTLAEALRAMVEGHDFPTVGRLTISVGVAEHRRGESATAWFDRADAAMYAAKDAGRNRVVVDRSGSSDAWAGSNTALRLVWQEAFECGEPTIDREHRELFDLANALIDATQVWPAVSGQVPAALDSLVGHVAKHFEDEERLLAQHDYEHLDAHRKAHAGLVKRAVQLQAELESGALTLGSVVDFVVGDVVARHLFVADRQFFPLFRSPIAATRAPVVPSPAGSR